MIVRRFGALVALALSMVAFVAFAGSVAAADPITIQIGPQNNSGISGTATLTDMGNGQTQVVVNVTGFTVGTPSPIHIHEGTCATLNPAVKFPLTNLVDGKSTTMVPVALSAVLAQPHAINAHKSAQEATVYVACGNITSQMPNAVPNTGAGGMAAGTSPLAPIAIAALLGVVVAGGLYTIRRRVA